jgi:hypothetical protein
VKAYRLADNRLGQETSWDFELLGIELEDLAGLDIDLSLTGFDGAELLMPSDFSPVGENEQPRLDQKNPVVCPECGHEFTV